MSYLGSEVEISRFSENGLIRWVYCFDYEGRVLRYTSHFTMNRSTRRSKWADQMPKALNYEKWCAKKGWDVDEMPDDDCNSDYREYCQSMNPVCQYTKQKQPLLGGTSGMIEHLPVCPQDVADEALEQFRRQAKVRYTRSKKE